jgi:hypothetical protein
MRKTVGDFIVERLYAWGVRKIFGYPGDGINGVFGALNRAQHKQDEQAKIEFIQARHEEMAAFALRCGLRRGAERDRVSQRLDRWDAVLPDVPGCSGHRIKRPWLRLQCEPLPALAVPPSKTEFARRSER